MLDEAYLEMQKHNMDGVRELQQDIRLNFINLLWQFTLLGHHCLSEIACFSFGTDWFLALICC